MSLIDDVREARFLCDECFEMVEDTKEHFDYYHLLLYRCPDCGYRSTQAYYAEHKGDCDSCRTGLQRA